MDRRDFSRSFSSDSRQSGGPYRNDRGRGGNRDSYDRGGDRRSNDFNQFSRGNSFSGGRMDYDRRDSYGSRGSGGRGEFRGGRGEFQGGRGEFQGGRGEFRGGRGGGGFRGGRGGGPGTGRQAADDSQTIPLPGEGRRCTIAEVNSLPAAREVSSMRVEANGYELDASRAKPAYQYDILWTGEFKNGKTQNINVHPKGDIKLNTKNEAITSLFNQLLRENDAFFKASEYREKYAYDTGSIFYSQNKLLGDMERRVFDLNVSNIDEKAKDYFRNIVKISADIRLTRQIRPDLLNGDLENDRPINQYLEVVFSQEQRNGGKYLCFNNKFFEKESNDRIEQTCLTLKSGVTRSIRLCDSENKKLMVQMIPTKTAFYDRSELSHLIEDAFKGDIRDICRGGPCWEKANAAVKNLTVKTIHLRTNRIFVAAGLSKNSADSELFEMDDKEVSVAQYFKDKYNFTLRYPSLPCVIEKKGKDYSFYPIEALEVLANQRIPKAKQSTDLNSKIIRKCQTLPAQNKTLIEHYRREADIANSNDYIKNTGIRVDATKMVTAPAKQLPPPAIVFKTTQKKLKSGLFGMQNGDKFAVGAEIRKFAVVNASREDPRRIQDFIASFLQRVETYDVQRVHPEFVECRNDIEKKLEDLVFSGFDFALVIGDSDELHHGMKFSELSTKMVTQHIRPQTMRKANNSLFDNLAFKFNLKAGGLNWNIASNPSMIIQSGNVDLLKSLTDGTLFIGIDLSHPLGRPEPGTPFADVDPTCVGFASNISRGNTNMEHGDYGYQYSQKTMVAPELLKSKFAAAVMAYYQKNGQFPSWIVVYRVGMSEGEVGKIRGNEVPVLKETLGAIRSQFPELPADIKLTAIMANKNSTLRIFNEHIPDGYAKAPAQNVPSGTCIYEKIVSTGGEVPSFVIIAQRALIGTARPTIYHVLEGADCVKMEHLQWLTYCLCFTHAIVTSPTALPGPLVAAADLSKRGRNNFKHCRQTGTALPIDENVEAQLLLGQGDALNDDEKEKLRAAEARYFMELSEVLHPKIEDKRFWA